MRASGKRTKKHHLLGRLQVPANKEHVCSRTVRHSSRGVFGHNPVREPVGWLSCVGAVGTKERRAPRRTHFTGLRVGSLCTIRQSTRWQRGATAHDTPRPKTNIAARGSVARGATPLRPSGRSGVACITTSIRTGNALDQSGGRAVLDRNRSHAYWAAGKKDCQHSTRQTLPAGSDGGGNRMVAGKRLREHSCHSGASK